MDKVEKYRKIVQDILLYYASLRKKDDPIETQVIFDDKRGHYLLMSAGWQGHNFIYGTIFHIDIRKDGKIWVQQDNTDAAIVEDLLEKGIPKSDIVLGFHSPYMRKLTDFAHT